MKKVTLSVIARTEEEAKSIAYLMESSDLIMKQDEQQPIAYYSHGMHIFDTPQETRDIDIIKALGYSVMNPNVEYAAYQFNEALQTMDYPEAFEYVFGAMIKDSDIVIFRSHPDGSIPFTTSKEIELAEKFDKIVIELPSGILKRKLNIDETEEYLKEIGQQ